jgi:hypothetical protein
VIGGRIDQLAFGAFVRFWSIIGTDREGHAFTYKIPPKCPGFVGKRIKIPNSEWESLGRPVYVFRLLIYLPSKVHFHLEQFSDLSRKPHPFHQAKRSPRNNNAKRRRPACPFLHNLTMELPLMAEILVISHHVICSNMKYNSI